MVRGVGFCKVSEGSAISLSRVIDVVGVVVDFAIRFRANVDDVSIGVVERDVVKAVEVVRESGIYSNIRHVQYPYIGDTVDLN